MLLTAAVVAVDPEALEHPDRHRERQPHHIGVVAPDPLHEGRGPTLDRVPARLTHALRSEEHTSELQSRQYLVCRLLLEKKKNKTLIHRIQEQLKYMHVLRKRQSCLL